MDYFLVIFLTIVKSYMQIIALYFGKAKVVFCFAKFWIYLYIKQIIKL